MRNLTQEEHETLKAYEHFFTMANADVVPGMVPKDYNNILAIYNSLTGKNEKPTGCSSCRLPIIKVVANAYYSFEEPIENQTFETEEVTVPKKKKTKKNA